VDRAGQRGQTPLRDVEKLAELVQGERRGAVGWIALDGNNLVVLDI
jgi:hypothetical protein